MIRRETRAAKAWSCVVSRVQTEPPAVKIDRVAQRADETPAEHCDAAEDETLALDVVGGKQPETGREDRETRA